MRAILFFAVSLLGGAQCSIEPKGSSHTRAADASPEDMRFKAECSSTSESVFSQITKEIDNETEKAWYSKVQLEALQGRLLARLAVYAPTLGDKESVQRTRETIQMSMALAADEPQILEVAHKAYNPGGFSAHLVKALNNHVQELFVTRGYIADKDSAPRLFLSQEMAGLPFLMPAALPDHYFTTHIRQGSRFLMMADKYLARHPNGGLLFFTQAFSNGGCMVVRFNQMEDWVDSILKSKPDFENVYSVLKNHSDASALTYLTKYYTEAVATRGSSPQEHANALKLDRAVDWLYEHVERAYFCKKKMDLWSKSPFASKAVLKKELENLFIFAP